MSTFHWISLVETIRQGVSEVLEIPLCLSQKILLIFMIPMMLHLSSYLLWGTRTRSYWFLCLHALPQHPLTYLDVGYAIRKAFKKGIQCTWNRRKHFSEGKVICRTSFMNRTHRGEWDQGTWIDLLEAWVVMCSHFWHCQGHWNKGDQGLYWNSVLWYKETQVMIRPHLILFISPLPQWGFWTNFIPMESYDRGESNGGGCLQGVWRRTHWGHWVLPKD